MAYIYKITNKINNKCYIGETTTTIEKRWNKHINESFNKGHGYNYHIHCAIRKYGIENFMYEEVEQCEDQYRFIREHYYIMFYNSLEPNGYNFLASGIGSTKVPIEAIIENWENGLDTVQISQQLGINRQTVSEHLKSNGITQEEIMNRHNKKVKERFSLPVLQYDLNGNFIKEWPSASSVSEENYSQSAISSVCRQEQFTAYGYIWKYKNDIRDINEWIDLLKNKRNPGKPKKKIIQLDNNNNILEEYESASEAAKKLGIKDKSNICTAARKNKKAYGYYWKYDN